MGHAKEDNKIGFQDRLSLRAILEKNTWRGKKANNIFFYGWLVRTFFKLYGSLVFEKKLITWVLGFIGKSITDV